VPKLFAAVLGGSPALSGGDLVSTGTAVMAGATTVASLGAGAIAVAAGGAAALSGGVGASAAGGGVPSAVASAGGARNIGGGAGGGSVPPPSSPPLGPSHGGRPRQPNPPTNGSNGAPSPGIANNVGSNGGGPVASNSGASSAGISRIAPSPTDSSTARSVLSSIGGESLVSSGFERERPAAGFVVQTVPVPAGSPGSSPEPPVSGVSSAYRAPAESGAPTETGSPAGPGAVSEVQSVTSPTTPKGATSGPLVKQRIASGARRTQRVFSGAADRLRGSRQQLGGLPSDAAPHTHPPRMPIDHNE
jgi:type IV secretion system protein TrbL